MITSLTIIKVIGEVSIVILFSMSFVISVSRKLFNRVGRASYLWISMYLFFITVSRFLSYSNIINQTSSVILGCAATLITLTAFILHLILNKKISDERT